MGNDLKSGLEAAKDHGRAALPPAVFEVFEADMARAADETKFAEAGVTVDDFALPGADGETVSLGQLVADGPAVLVFYRGQWCPFCNLTLRTYQQEVVPELAKLGATLAAISPQTADGSLSTREKNELGFAVLSDVGNVVSRQLGLAFRVSDVVREAMSSIGTDLGQVNGTGEWELVYPAVVVVDRDRTIRYVDVHPDYTTRTEPSQILEAVKSL
ncbi:peroxiredoxin-like family protein [Amycolatopsis sp. NPDC049252]|uniref:peroxiredoxin-like family protein n=1 Tax=Amycolatopsis sp. NPDC049252 TaxID=3363933 RepID=UPI00371FBBB9